MSNPSRENVRSTLLRGIQIEARNAKVYDTFAQLFQGYDDSVTAIFREMADEERQHGTDLEQRYRARFGAVPAPAEEPKEVIEAPELEDSEALIFDSMTLVEALEVGLKAELMAREFYQHEAGRISDPDLQKLYRELSEFEEDHIRRLEEKLAEKGRAPKSTAR